MARPAALLGLATLLLLNMGVTALTARIARAERFLEGRPRFLVRNGTVDYATLRREGISKKDLLSALRENACLCPSQADWAVLETDGVISVKMREE